MTRAMSETWFDRLAAAIEADGRSLRKISSEAGLGPNFVQQMLKDRKEPGIENMLSVLQALGTASLLYVLTGKDFTRADEEFLKLVLNMSPELRQSSLTFLRSLKGSVDAQ